MNKKTYIILGAIFIGLSFFLLSLLMGGEGSWTCENNIWVKHGSPSSPAPTSGCGDEKPATATDGIFDPLNATYFIDGLQVTLVDGKASRESAPDSSSKVTTSVFGEPVSGDLNGDGNGDAGLLIVQTSGGSGTFYYMAGAINKGDRAEGVNAILLGDRIAPQNIEIKNGMMVANYAERNAGEPMSTRPSRGTSKYVIFENGKLVDISGTNPKSRPFAGMLTWGHEVREFSPCGGEDDYWIMGNSPALSDVQKTYTSEMSESKPYAPLFAIVTGFISPSPQDGFGADYSSAITIEKLVRMDVGQTCEE